MHYSAIIFMALTMASCAAKTSVFGEYDHIEDKECPNSICIYIGTLQYDTYQPVLNSEFVNIVDECIPLR